MKRKDFIQNTALIGIAPLLSWSNGLNLPSNPEKPILTAPTMENSYWYIGHLLSILLTNKQTNGAFSLIHGYEIKGLEPPPHTHTREDESFYLLSGKIEFAVGKNILKANPGDWVYLPRNMQHSFQVKTDKAEVLILLSPGGFENYFIEMGEPAQKMEIPPKPEGPPDVQKIIETASRYGIKFPKFD